MFKELTTILAPVVVSMTLIFVVGCQEEAQTGALLGSLVGAGIGQLAGGDTESTLVGAAVGGGVGYILGNENDKRRAEARMYWLREEMGSVTVNITNSNGSISRVRLRKHGVGYVGTRGEYYSKLPTEEQLRPVYGF